MVPLNVRNRNAVERSMCTFKEHFFRLLARVDEKFPMHMWNHLIPQVVITLNALENSEFHPPLSA